MLCSQQREDSYTLRVFCAVVTDGVYSFYNAGFLPHVPDFNALAMVQ